VSGSDPPPGELVDPGRVVALTVSSGPQPIEVPKVVGFERAAADAMIQLAGLQVGDVSERRDQETGIGRVVEVRPGAGQKLNRGERVDLVVSAGPTRVQLPDLADEPVAEARRVVRELGLTERPAVERPSPEIRPDRVIGTEPGAGASLEIGAPVTLTVSTGPRMPEVVGGSLDAATMTLQKEGLDVGIVTMRVGKRPLDNGTPVVGRVVGASVGGSDPETGTQVAPGTRLDPRERVNLFVLLEPPPQQPGSGVG
jgi:beta-lactam-binding protein with PASTA domain